jgi:hypothetical protein
MTSPLRTGSNAAALAGGHAMIAAHREVFAAFAGAALATPDDLEAVALAEMAYGWAFRKHPGLLACAPLEGRIHEIGLRHVPGVGDVRPTGDVRSVLHVATEVYDYGGHTRVLERWIERDCHRRSTLMVLRHDLPIPAATARAVERAGAAIVRPAAHADVVERARHLRALAALHDLVVLHVHPYETITALAFADPVGRPPVVLFNHASHQLWLGVGAVDVVASLWEPDRAIAVARRGFADERSVVLPLPATPGARPSSADARAALGLPAGAKVLATVASPYKVQQVLEPAFADLCRHLLDARDDLHLVAAGPMPGDAALPVHPRVHALGVVSGLGPIYAAADLLLDTWPASGGTVVIDAAAAGLPIVSLGDGAAADAMVRPPAGLLGGAVHVTPTVRGLVELATGLLEDDDRRQAIGAAAAAFATGAHGDAGWQDALEGVVAAAVAHAGEAALPDDGTPVEPSDAEAVLALLFAEAHAGFTPYHAYLHSVASLPPARRPADEGALRARVEQLLALRAAAAAARPRAVAAPSVTAEAIGRLVADVRSRVAADEIGSCIVVVAPDEVPVAVELLEAALAAGPDVDLELVAAGGVAEVARHGDVTL